MTLKVLQMLGQLLRVKRKRHLTQSYSMHPGLKWRGKAKDYPGAKEIVNMNKQGITGKKKPKIRIV